MQEVGQRLTTERTMLLLKGIVFSVGTEGIYILY